LLKSLVNIFRKNENIDENNHLEDLELLCGIMVEAANSDGNIDSNEVKKISNILIDIFKEDPKNVNLVLKEALSKKDETNSLFFFTSKINKTFSEEKKLLLIETLWEIILEDGEIHDFESNLIRRLAGLIYISDVNCGNAKKRALSKIEKNG
tara:strand:- start:1498 stop:1953 length:456 start_codon:yes stop_codon:yes gene_type:complete